MLLGLCKNINFQKVRAQNILNEFGKIISKKISKFGFKKFSVIFFSTSIFFLENYIFRNVCKSYVPEFRKCLTFCFTSLEYSLESWTRALRSKTTDSAPVCPGGEVTRTSPPGHGGRRRPKKSQRLYRKLLKYRKQPIFN